LLKQLENRNVPTSFLILEQQNINQINELLTNIELSPAEERTLLWLCGWERSTVQNICSVIRKIKG